MRYLFLVFLLFIDFSFLDFSKIDSNKSKQESVLSPRILSSDVYFMWKDSFSYSEKQKLRKWLFSVVSANEKLFGTYPFPIYFFMHRSQSLKEPVPWAHTNRYGKQGVHFHVNTDFLLADFMKDWTAPHEISHLSIPFVGKENAWFAEGYASYFQYQTMFKMGVYAKNDVILKYREKLKLIKAFYTNENDLVSQAKQFRKIYRFPQMYWGGAVFFMQLDYRLKRANKLTFAQIIYKYQKECRLKDKNIEDLLFSLDSISETKIIGDLYKKFNEKPALNFILEMDSVYASDL